MKADRENLGDDAQTSRQIWTDYWRSGRRGCLTDEAPPWARDHVAQLWREWFLQQARGARILDLACGAGDVARIALSSGGAADLAFAIEGVDLADFIGPCETASASVNGTTMRLRAGINLADLPFPDNSFDCEVSQFGIEYAETQAAVRELARTLKSDGCGLFLLHHKASVVSAAAASRLDAFIAVFGDDAVFEKATSVYEAISAGKAQSVVTARLGEFRQSLRSAVGIYSAHYAWETNLRDIMDFLSDLARNPGVYDPSDAVRRVHSAREAIAAWKLRQESQLAAALDDSGMQALADVLRRYGLNPREIAVVHNPSSGAILAWRCAFAAAGFVG